MKKIGIYIHRTRDAEWEENKHPRAENGQFGKGSGGSKSPVVAAKEKRIAAAVNEGKNHKASQEMSRLSPEQKAEVAKHGTLANYKAVKRIEARRAERKTLAQRQAEEDRLRSAAKQGDPKAMAAYKAHRQGEAKADVAHEHRNDPTPQEKAKAALLAHTKQYGSDPSNPEVRAARKGMENEVRRYMSARPNLSRNEAERHVASGEASGVAEKEEQIKAHLAKFPNQTYAQAENAIHAKNSSEYAHDLSSMAESNPSTASHNAAAEAHKKAGDLNDKSGNIEEASKHYRLSGFHERAAEHQRQIEEGNRGLESVTLTPEKIAKAGAAPSGGDIRKAGRFSEFPILSHKGEEYSHTGKEGHDMKTGEHSKEYEDDSGSKRLWLRTHSGKIDED